MGDVTATYRARLPRLFLAPLALTLFWPLGLAATADEALTGVIAIDHADYFEEHLSSEVPMLEVGAERLELRNVSAANMVAGSRVTVRGRRVGAAVYVDFGGIRPARHDSALAASGSASTSMDKRVAVLMVNFVAPTPTPTTAPTDSPNPTDPLPTDPPSASPTTTSSPATSPGPTPSPSPKPPPEPWTADFLRGIYFTNTRSVADYYREVSDGKMSVTGDVFGWFTVPADTTSCNHTDWGDAARAAATASGVDLAAYTNVAVVFPKQAVCGWVGMAQLPGRNSYVNGLAGWTSRTWLFVPTHELGHNFGMNHASTISCREAGVRVAFSGDCTKDEYGDPYDTMGGDGQRHFNTWHRWQMGTLTAADVQTVTATGTYTVAPAEIAGGTPRVLRIARPAGNYFYLEYRQPYGRYDDFSSTANVVNGVLIRLAPGVSSESFSKLIDTNPQTSAYSDSALGVGRGFADKSSDIFVITRALSPAGATVFVQVGPDTNLPTAPQELSATVDAAGSVGLSWLSASDDLFVSGYQVARDGKSLGWTYDTSFIDPDPPQANSHTYSVSAVDGAGNVGPAASAVVGQTDVTPPVLEGPLSLSVGADGAIDVSWPAGSDDVDLAGYSISRDDVPLATVVDTAYVDPAPAQATSYEYVVVAKDAAGNRSAPLSGSIYLPDITAPSVASALSAAAGGFGSVTLTWSAATDNVGVAGYHISRDGLPLADVGANALSYSDPAVALGSHTYSLAAFDAAHNVGPSVSASVALADAIAPSVPLNLAGAALGKRRVSLTWSASTDNRPGAITYRIFRGTRRIAVTTATSFVDRPASVGNYKYRVRAVDAAGNKSNFSAAIWVKARL